MSRPRTLLLSPFAGNVEQNIRYAREALLHSLESGEAPFASHLLYTQVLDDTVLDRRMMGLECETQWLLTAQRCVAYTDLGWSPGMEATRKIWLQLYPEISIHERQLGGVWEEVAQCK